MLLDFAGTDYPPKVFPSLCESCNLYNNNIVNSSDPINGVNTALFSLIVILSWFFFAVIVFYTFKNFSVIKI